MKFNALKQLYPLHNKPSFWIMLCFCISLPLKNSTRYWVPIFAHSYRFKERKNQVFYPFWFGRTFQMLANYFFVTTIGLFYCLPISIQLLCLYKEKRKKIKRPQKFKRIEATLARAGGLNWVITLTDSVHCLHKGGWGALPAVYKGVRCAAVMRTAVSGVYCSSKMCCSKQCSPIFICTELYYADNYNLYWFIFLLPLFIFQH